LKARLEMRRSRATTGRIIARQHVQNSEGIAQGWANGWNFGTSERGRSHAVGRRRPLPKNLAAHVPADHPFRSKLNPAPPS
jgi:hypothetical protein